MRQITGIKCLDRTSPNAKQVLVFFHGYGADAYDLMTLSDVIVPQKESDWIFPQGFLEVPIGPGWTGRAWWNIDMNALQAAAVSGVPRDLSDQVPDGLSVAREKISHFMSEFMKKSGFAWNQIIFGGFSQGAMLATDLFLGAAERPKGLIIMSGALIDKMRWKELAKNRAQSRVFMCHGKQDMVLGIKGAQQLESLLSQAGIKTKLNQFEGGHEIPPHMITLINEYLNSLE
jgi:phospholipase/carboxylesterase